MKILFLDIDGVLNSESWCAGKPFGNPFENPQKWIDPNSIRLLNLLIDRMPCKVVLTSNWREHFNKDEIQSYFNFHGFYHEIMDMTPQPFLIENETEQSSKNHEIFLWLFQAANNKQDIQKFVIVDDRPKLIQGLEKFLVSIDPHVGLTQKNCEEIFEKLK